MRSSILTEEDVGNIEHDRALKVGEVQSMVFHEASLPPIFHPDAPKHDSLTPGSLVTRKLTSKELKQMLETNSLNSDGLVAVLRARATLANIPITETKGEVIAGYVGKPKGAKEIACERGFFLPTGVLSNGKKVTLNGTPSKDAVTGVVNLDKTTSVIRMLKRCSDFKNEQTQISHILNLLGISVRLTPKCHPEIAGRGVEYAWGYAKLQFRCKFNDAIAKNLKDNVLKSLDRDVITVDRSRKFARKAREYKLTYALIVDLANGTDATAGKDEIEHITRMFKAHRSAMDADYGFISRS